jgi:hypothetical protein
MKFAVIENQTVTNLVVSDPEFAQLQGWINCADDVNIGWSYKDGIFLPPVIDYSEQNKIQASQILQTTDWTQAPDVSNTTRSPHLINANEFANYREIVRAIAINPPKELAQFPTMPVENWS